MQLTKAEKERQVAELAEKISKSSSVVVWNHNGLNVTEFNNVRQTLKDNNCETKIYKNTLAKIAFKNSGHEELANSIEGISSFGFSYDENSNVSKILFDDLKKISKHEDALRFGISDGSFQDNSNIVVIATLPSKTELLSMLLSVLQAPMKNTAYLVSQVADKRA